MHYYRNPADLAAIVAHLAPYASPAVIAGVTYAEANDEALSFYGADHTAPIAVVFADGSVEVVA